MNFIVVKFDSICFVFNRTDLTFKDFRFLFEACVSVSRPSLISAFFCILPVGIQTHIYTCLHLYVSTSIYLYLFLYLSVTCGVLIRTLMCIYMVNAY